MLRGLRKVRRMKPLTNGLAGHSPQFDGGPPLESGDRLTRDEFEQL